MKEHPHQEGINLLRIAQKAQLKGQLVKQVAITWRRGRIGKITNSHLTTLIV